VWIETRDSFSTDTLGLQIRNKLPVNLIPHFF
jgi:hypothetical protein